MREQRIALAYGTLSPLVPVTSNFDLNLHAVAVLVRSKQTMRQYSSWLAVWVGLVGSAAACGSEESLVPLEPGLTAPPTRGDAGTDSGPAETSSSSSSSSGEISSSSSSSGEPAPEPDAGPEPQCTGGEDLPAAVRVNGLPEQAAEPGFTDDELHVYYINSADHKVYHAQRATRGDSFQVVGQLQQLGINDLHHVSITNHGLTLYVTQIQGGQRTLYLARRDSTNDNFGAASFLLSNASNLLVTRDDLTYFTLRRIGPAGDVWWDLALRNPDGTPATHNNWRTSDSDYNTFEIFPSWFDTQTNTLWFNSVEYKTKGAISKTQQRIRSAFRDPNTGVWKRAELAEDRVVWISPDNCRRYSVQDNKGIFVQTLTPTSGN